MDTRLLARLITVARSVNPVTALTATTAATHDRSAEGSVRAHVEARLEDGRFRVSIEGRPQLLKLPPDVRTGDIIELRLPAGATASRPPPAIASNSTAARAEVSSTGRLLGALLGTDAPPPSTSSAPIVDGPTVESDQLAGPLARAIEKSGLFYESHQARWVAGEYPLDRLREEPQAAAGTARSTGDARDSTQFGPSRSSTDQAAHTTPAQLRERGPSPVVELPERTAITEPPRDPVTGETRREIAAPETLPIIRQQLETLEHRNLGWMGEIWPGQTMRWEISEEGGERADDEQARLWSTRFDLCLPELGDVGASLAFGPNGVRITLSAAQQSTVAEMQAAKSDLERALAEAGVGTAAIRMIQAGGAGSAWHDR